MNHEKTIKRIQSLVPSVLDLEFGCVVETNIFPSYLCHFRLCYKTWKSDILVCENNEGEQVLLSINDCKILGKPITLSVVLLAIIKDDGLPITFLEAEKVEIGHDWSNIMFHFRDMNWNLSKDNFNDQSEETKTFIGGLLGN